MGLRGRKTLVAVTAGAVTGFLGLWIVPAARSELGPSTIAVSLFPGSGETHVSIPPLGQVNANTQRAPVTIEVALQEVNVEDLALLATSEGGRAQLRDDVESDLKAVIIRAGLQSAGGMVLIGLIAGLVLFRRALWPAAASGLGAFVVALALLATVGVSYDVNGFREPRFTGTLKQARGVIDAVQRNIDLFDEARSRFDVATERAADLLTQLAQPAKGSLADTTVILHVSDIHGNPVGLDVTKRLASEFEVDAIVDTGDLASSTFDTGALSRLSAPLEHSMIRQIERLPARYVFVAGNHDSFALRNALQKADNVDYLDGDTTLIEGLQILGWADPTYTPEAVEEEDKAEERLEEAPEVAAAIDNVGPFILAVHDPRLASESIGLVPVILAGHTHERTLLEQEGTTMLTVGSTGATGLKSFTVEAERDYEAQILYFDGPSLIAVDYVSLRALGSEFVIERDTIP